MRAWKSKPRGMELQKPSFQEKTRFQESHSAPLARKNKALGSV